MALLFVTGTNTEVGKSYTSIKLIDFLASLGLKVGACKPIETGVNSLPQDASLLLESIKKYNPNFSNFQAKDLCAYTFKLPSAPFCADVNQEINISKIFKKIDELESLCDILIVEGAGGLMVPITKDFMMIDLAKRLNAYTLLVTPSNLGCINETLLSIEALKSYKIPFNWCVNLYKESKEFAKVTLPYYEKAFPNWWRVEDGFEQFYKEYQEWSKNSKAN